ncbi:hypothetical protein ENUP19_0294G0009 [Entamoeba nuttalli]|uniref:Leucine rich repeat protein, BspA family protein n=1 Tax=Entamoeba nuttalli TaxID=412467 RepID=A0ABQ0DUC2_9EUKA
MQIGYNEIMIVSKYFEDINDFINLEMGVKRFRGNMERFHFNPIPLNQYSRKLFPNIETFHIYNKYDEIFEDGKIFKQIIWYKVDYSTYLKEKEAMNECKNIEYTKEDRNTYGNTIPIEVNSLGTWCFSRCDDIQEIEIPTSVTEIRSYCFEGCSSLTSINIPLSVCKIGNGCFSRCSSLTSIEIPTNVSNLGNGCFSWCSSLTSINIPSIITLFGIGCLYGCSSLITINIPTSVTKIGDSCFEECSSITSLTIEGIKYISEERIFMNEPVLISIEIPENLKIINGKHIEKKDINDFNIPTTITKLGNGCFNGCTSLTTINIPTSVTEIEYNCFSGCSSLTTINIPTSVTEIGNWCFTYCTSLTTIEIPTTITSFGNGCFYHCGCEEELKMNKTIPEECFEEILKKK